MREGRREVQNASLSLALALFLPPNCSPFLSGLSGTERLIEARNTQNATKICLVTHIQPHLDEVLMILVCWSEE